MPVIGSQAGRAFDEAPLPTSRPPRPSTVELTDIRKSYGATHANGGVDLTLHPGEVVGLIGANGAGKSTLMKILCGVETPDGGRLTLSGCPVVWAQHNARAAHAKGIRIVHQEGSLCSNLTVAENFFLEQPDQARFNPFWLSLYRQVATGSLAEIFPGTQIDPDAIVDQLSPSQRQMVEITRAVTAPGLQVLVLDEPTSSLDHERSQQLQAYIRTRAQDGLSVIFISHKLQEVLEISDRVVAMRGGRIVWTVDSGKAHVSQLVEIMGGGLAGEIKRDRSQRNRTAGDVKVRVTGALTEALGHTVELRSGEIIGLAGLEGSGQREFLHALWQSPHRDLKVTGRLSFVSGDRQREGVFPLWTVLANIALGRVASRSPLAAVSDAEEASRARHWLDRLSLDASRLPSNILDLSGGNQQKALVARSLVSDAESILLDDPTRGVDIATKREFYALANDLATEGRLLVWRSTEDIEFLECDRVLIFQEGRIVRELVGGAVDVATIVEASFDRSGSRSRGQSNSTTPARLAARALQTIPFISLALVFGTMAALNPNVASTFGLDLLLGPAVALALLAMAQMFVVGGSEIDLGLGMFAGLVNVITATLLVDTPYLGLVALAAGVIAYGGLALLIHGRGIPAIVVTLGASFIWAGIGQTIQPAPGGSSPEWLTAAFTWSIPGLPTPLVLLALIGVAAVVIDRSPLGTVLRGFGNAPAALERSGWSRARYAVFRYLIAGLFGTVAGLWLTASNQASDINAGASYTLLSIAAVVIGGCQLLGGVIAPLGTLAGAVTLSLIGALLASIGVSTDFNAAVQGALLLAILILSTALTWRTHRE